MLLKSFHVIACTTANTGIWKWPNLEFWWNWLMDVDICWTFCLGGVKYLWGAVLFNADLVATKRN